MRVNIDPETGQYTASPVLPSQATAAMKAPSEPPRQQALGGGVYKLDTRGVRHAFVATANPGGLPQTHCIDVRSPQD